MAEPPNEGGSEEAASFRDGRYAVTKVLGEGGQATSYQAVDKKEGRLVVVKRFRVRGAKAWKEVELAEREARVLATVRHPSLPRYVEHFEEGGELFLVTEFIEGESLAARAARGERLSVAEVVKFLESASDALAYLHGRAPPIVHRDIKPSNVLRRPDGSFAIIDFGAVRDRMKPEGGSTVVGTFGYMAPEQFQGRAMPASDVYAVGATALVLLTGTEPESLPHRGLGIDVAASLAGTSAEPWLVQALGSMLEPDPDRRSKSLVPLLERRAKRSEARQRVAHTPESPWPFRGDEREKSSKPDKPPRPKKVRGYGRPLELGGPIGWVVHIALLVAEVTVRFALRTVLAPAFDATSATFGRAWREAAKTLRRADDEAQDEIARARAYTVGTRFRRAPAERVRVRISEFTNDERARARDEAAEEEADADAEAEAEERERRSRRR